MPSQHGSLFLGHLHCLPASSNPLTGAILAMLRVANSLSNDSLKTHLLVLSSLYEDISRVLRNKMCLGYTRHKITPLIYLHTEFIMKQNYEVWNFLKIKLKLYRQECSKQTSNVFHSTLRNVTTREDLRKVNDS